MNNYLYKFLQSLLQSVSLVTLIIHMICERQISLYRVYSGKDIIITYIAAFIMLLLSFSVDTVFPDF